MQLQPDWVENPPDDIETRILLLDQNAEFIQESSPRGETLRFLFNECKVYHQDALTAVQYNEPQAFFKPSYEQALLLNAWFWGINFPICFSANRIGKTVAFVFNALLWIFPNNPQWLCFKPYKDYLGRYVRVLERPALKNILKLQEFYLSNPELVGSLYKQPEEDCNVAKATLVRQNLAQSQLLSPAWPYPPIQKGGQIWIGAPDNEFHNSILRKRWRELLPKASILKDSDADHKFHVTTASTTNPKTTAFEIISKSYESEDTKWSGDAVTGVSMTEGFTQDILDEVKNRLTNESFASWDYTPAEPRNTGKKVALAYKVYQGHEELPLRSHVFVKFSVRTAPEHIIPKEKKADLIRMWEGRDAGKARLEGDFFSSSGLVLDSLDRKFHCLNWSLAELLARYPGGQFYRGLDPGFDHPAACCWGYLSPNNIWFIYRFYSKRGTTISERCSDIIALSHNAREPISSKFGQKHWREVHPNPDSEVFIATTCDYHAFKTDETTGLSFSHNYINEGLIITPSIHMRPEERATKANDSLNPHTHIHIAHPLTNKPPGAKVFFLINGHGVANALDRFDQLFWDRFKSGENRGEPKDKVPIHGDDELDAFCYLVCSPYVHTRFQPRRHEPKENLEKESPWGGLKFALDARTQPVGFS